MAILGHYSEAIDLVDFQAFCDKAEQQGELIYQQLGFESRFNLPQQLGKGGESEIWLRDGMSLLIRDGELSRPIKLENHYSSLPPLVSKFHLSGNSRVLTPNVSEINAMKQVLQQTLHCSYQDIMKQMYLESKALELLSLQFAEWTAGLQQQKQSLRLRSEDIERLHYAGEILLQQAENPPSLLALARQVGIDDCKLKWGFRQLFGTTVFGYLHEHRMERSRQLLAMGQMSVTEVEKLFSFFDT